MENQNSSTDTIENLKKIDAIANMSTPLFFMAVAHLFEKGLQAFREVSRETVLADVEQRHREAEEVGEVTMMTRSYERDLQNTTCDLAGFPLFDLLLYIKKSMDIYDPEAVLTEDQEEE